MPFYVFMTGASKYRCEARDRHEVLRIVRETLKPDGNTLAVIESTLYEESDAAQYIDEESEVG